MPPQGMPQVLKRRPSIVIEAELRFTADDGDAEYELVLWLDNGKEVRFTLERGLTETKNWRL